MGDNYYDLAMMQDCDNDDSDWVDDKVRYFIAPPVNDETALAGCLRIGDAVYKEQAQEICTKFHDFNKARLQAEKNLLFTALQGNALIEMHELQKGLNPFTVRNYNRMVNISQVEFHFSQSSDLVRRYCLIVLTSPTQLYISQFAKPNSEGIFNFNMNHTIFGLPTDWRIDMKIHVLTLLREYPKPWLADKVAPVWVPTEKKVYGVSRPSLFQKYEQFVITPTFQNGRHAITLSTSPSSSTHKILFNVLASSYNLP